MRASISTCCAGLSITVIRRLILFKRSRVSVIIMVLLRSSNKILPRSESSFSSLEFDPAPVCPAEAEPAVPAVVVDVDALSTVPPSRIVLTSFTEA